MRLPSVWQTGIYNGWLGAVVAGLVIDIVVKQPLLRSVLPDGTVVLLVVLHDDRCAILRNNEMIHQASGDADGIDGAVQRFMTMTQVSDVLGGGDRQATSSSQDEPAPASRSEMSRDEHPPAAAMASSNPSPAVPPPAAPRQSA
jgi:hypothetical protein